MFLPFKQNRYLTNENPQHFVAEIIWKFSSIIKQSRSVICNTDQSGLTQLHILNTTVFSIFCCQVSTEAQSGQTTH